ncbi:hypothetical protein [Maribacter halichondriae]|uniref:hypothetical protein n=1 Tax=Maribacter halichondriae TaxID=2980554 RepID=UPI002359F23A|nr:hypothetical protein [Maribacter sp. Hal144]
MKKVRLILTLIFTAVILIISCSKDEESPKPKDIVQQQDPSDPEKPDEQDPPTEGQVQMVDVQVNLPADSNLDLSTTTIVTLASPGEVKENGVGSVPFNPGSFELAYLFDASDKLLLSGFISDDRKEISVATTTEVMLYFGLGSYLQPSEFKKGYLQGVQGINGFQELKNSIEALFVEDPYMYEKGSYLAVIDAKIAELSTIEYSDLAARVAVDSKDLRSGIQLSDVDDSSMKITNWYPRRGHAFVYKKSFKDEDGNETVLNSSIEGNDMADIEVALEPAKAIFTDGSNNKYVQCNQANQFSNTVTEPIDLNLLESQSSAEYEVVVVGPGGKANLGRTPTNAEQAKIDELNKESFVLDYFLPTLLDIGGNKDLLPEFGDAKEQELVNAVLPFLEANPDVTSDVLDNNYQEALEEFLPALYGDIRQSDDLRELLKGVYGVLSKTGNSPETFVQGNELIETGYPREKYIISVIDKNIKSSSTTCVNKRIGDSRPMETWDVSVSEGKVKLSAKNGCMQLRGYVDITARVTTELEEGDELEYEWSTTTQFGGNVNDFQTNGANITSTKETVTFSSTALNSELSDGNNIETVTVKAFVKNANGRSEVGSDEIQVCILKDKFIIKPNGICIKGNSGAVLRLIHNNGATTIPNNETDYKVVWTTSGTYGNFLDGNSVATTYNTNAMSYQSFDTKVKKGIDTFTAIIYGKPKGSSEAYQQIDEAEGAICVNNEPKELVTIIDSQFFVIEGDVENNGGTRMSHFNTFRVFPNPDAVSYKIEVLDYKYQGVSQPSQITSRSWQADNETFLRTVNGETFSGQ